MARTTFSVEAASSRLNLSRTTREQIKALILDLDQDATAIVELAIAQLWQRELGEPERDLAAELDELKAEIKALQSK